MKAVNSSSYSSSSLPNIMIPQFQQLLPLETTLSGTWTNIQCTTDLIQTTNKLLSPPISITPSSVCTELSESEFQTVELTSLRKYSLSSPPLSNIKGESIDLIDCIPPHAKQESVMIISNQNKNTLEKSNTSCKTTKKCSNFSIDYILSSSFSPPTYDLLKLSHRKVVSIFTKKNTKHYSDNYLHRTIHYRQCKTRNRTNSLSSYSNKPRGLLIGYIFDLCSDLFTKKNTMQHRENIFPVDALQQLADIACKLDTRHKKAQSSEKALTAKHYDLLSKQCCMLIKQIYRKTQNKRIRKRLNFNSKLNFKNRFLKFSLLILNILRMENNILLYGSNHSNCHILTSDLWKNFFETKITKGEIKQSICYYLKSDQVTSNVEILIPNHGLLYEAVIQCIDGYDDLLLVRLHQERQVYLIPLHDLCRLACPKLIPQDFSVLSKGSRVCAYWSTSLRGLHPAIVKKMPSDIDESSMVTLTFDDGDTGLIKLDEIRLLPDGYDLKGIDLEEWRVSSSQILPILSNIGRTSRRMSSAASIKSNSSTKKKKKEKNTSSNSTVVPKWTLNTRNSTICRQDNKQILRAGDCVILEGVDKSLSYIGKVLKFYHNKSTQQDLVRLQWYYSPQETPMGLHKNDLHGALYESTHIDDNAITTIRYKGTIYASYDDYVKKTDYGKKRQETEFYLVGHYNTTSGKLQRYDGK